MIHFCIKKRYGVTTTNEWTHKNGDLLIDSSAELNENVLKIAHVDAYISSLER